MASESISISSDDEEDLNLTESYWSLVEEDTTGSDAEEAVP